MSFASVVLDVIFSVNERFNLVVVTILSFVVADISAEESSSFVDEGIVAVGCSVVVRSACVDGFSLVDSSVEERILVVNFSVAWIVDLDAVLECIVAVVCDRESSFVVF